MQTGKYPARMPVGYMRPRVITQQEIILNNLNYLSSNIKEFGIELADDNKTIINEYVLTEEQKNMIVSFQSILNNADYDTIFAFANSFREIAGLDDGFIGISMSEWYVFLHVITILRTKFGLRLSTISQSLETRCGMCGLETIKF